MHMSDALISPAVGGTLWVATSGLTLHAARRVERAGEEARVALMGVLGAFVFAAQMVNFTIPGTGSSGHLGGGLLLAILVGPHAAFLVMASVLSVQALFFADGGLLALGCNIFNLAFFACYVAYPLLWRPIAGATPTRGRLVAASLVAGVAGLELGALGVVLETRASGISSLPLPAFASLMLAIHLAIGLVEGLVTATVVQVVWRARPEVLTAKKRLDAARLRPLVAGLAAVALVAGGLLSWFASLRPDGLEWAVSKLSGEPLAAHGEVHAFLARLQGATALLPDYHFTAGAAAAVAGSGWPARGAGVSTSGLVGSLLVLGLCLAIGAGLRARRRRTGPT
jgi:cobalt/nickel transport system permease protein